jgi:hypothetical protein
MIGDQMNIKASEKQTSLTTKLIMLFSFIALASLLLASCGGSDKNDAAAGKTGIENLPEIDSTYYASVATWVQANLFNDKTPDEAYSYAVENNMHYLYGAFLKLYPDHPQIGDVQNRLTRFGVLRAPNDTSLIVSLADLESKYNLGSVQTVYYWGDGLGFMQVAANGQQIWQGPICLGNLQMLKGKFSAALTTDNQDGIELFPGTIMIYPLDNMEANKSTGE